MYSLLVLRYPFVLLLQVVDLVLRGVLVLFQVGDIVLHLAHLELSLLNGLLLILDRALESFQLVIKALESSKLVFKFSVMAVVRVLKIRQDLLGTVRESGTYLTFSDLLLDGCELRALCLHGFSYIFQLLLFRCELALDLLCEHPKFSSWAQ